MRVALLSFEFPPETGFGGIGTYTWHHARALAGLGHEVHVLAGAREASPLRTEHRDGVVLHRFWGGRLALGALRGLGSLRLWWTRQRLQNAWSMYHGLAALGRQHRFDVVEMPECGAEGALVTRLIDAPTVVRLHSPSQLIMPFYDVSGLDTRLCAAIENGPVNAATQVTACSRFVAAEARAALGVNRPIEVIPNGLDLEWFDGAADHGDVYARHGLPRRDLLMLFAGRLERRKGITLCPEIAAAILERYNVTFVLAGDDLFGYGRRTLLPALAGRTLKGSIHCLGALDLASVRELVRAADIFLLPSLWENCPYSCLEAMAARRAIVCANQGGMPELIRDGINGLVADTGSVASFVRRIEELIEDAALRRTLGAAARETIERAHRHIDIAQRSVALYKGLAAGRRAAAA